MNLKEILITAIVTLGIVVLLGSFIQDYLTSPDPVLYMGDNCYRGFSNNRGETITIWLENKGETPALVNLCISSREFTFKWKEGLQSNGSMCWNEGVINPKQTGLSSSYQIVAELNSTTFNSIENATIKVSASCKQKIWSIATKECEKVIKTCNYKRDTYTNYFELTN